MADVIFKLSEEHESQSKNLQSLVLDKEIEEFSKYMESLSDMKANGPLVTMERAILKTYMIYKLRGDK